MHSPRCFKFTAIQSGIFVGTPGLKGLFKVFSSSKITDLPVVTADKFPSVQLESGSHFDKLFFGNELHFCRTYAHSRNESLNFQSYCTFLNQSDVKNSRKGALRIHSKDLSVSICSMLHFYI